VRRTLPVLLLLVAGAVALGACGGSGSSTTTATGTVPTGKLGDAGCPAPKVKGFNVVTFAFGGLTCAEAQYYGEQLIRDSKITGWDCGTARVSGPYARTSCTSGGPGRSRSPCSRTRRRPV
jgi:hypothetical protein